VPGEEAKKAFEANVNAYAQRLWGMMEAEAGAPWFLGPRFTALDLYIAVMTKWRPRRTWFAEHAPRLHAIAVATESLRGMPRFGGGIFRTKCERNTRLRLDPPARPLCAARRSGGGAVQGNGGEQIGQGGPSGRGQLEPTIPGRPNQPALLQIDGGQRRAEHAAEMVTPFAPVEATSRKSSAMTSNPNEFDA
jgi:hypothetical protein